MAAATVQELEEANKIGFFRKLKAASNAPTGDKYRL